MIWLYAVYILCSNAHAQYTGHDYRLLGNSTFTTVNNPYAIAIDGMGNAWVTGHVSDTVTKLSSTGKKLGTFSVGALPEAIAIDGNGNAWVANNDGNSVTKLSSNGNSMGTFSVGVGPLGIAFDNVGNAWVTNSEDGTVTKLNSFGKHLSSLISNHRRRLEPVTC